MQFTTSRRLYSLMVGATALTLSTVGCGEDPVIDSSNRGGGHAPK
jgi:hypothetical protein